jgi:hypothetical protein
MGNFGDASDIKQKIVTITTVLPYWVSVFAVVNNRYIKLLNKNI